MLGASYADCPWRCGLPTAAQGLPGSKLVTIIGVTMTDFTQHAPHARAMFVRTQAPLWRASAKWLMLCMAWVGISSATGQTVSAPPAPFVIGLDAPAGTYVFKWLDLIYSDAFKRLGVPYRLESYALKRQGLQSEAGGIDGEANRAYGYGATRPTLIRIEETILELQLALFSADPALRLQRLEDLSSKGLLAEYRRGLLLCEHALKPVVSPDRLSDVATEDQGLKKLQARRTDVYCDFTLTVALAMRTPELKGGAEVRKAMDVGNPIPTYPYVHQKHKELAPRLTAVLKKIKAEGLFESYRLQVERELGW